MRILIALVGGLLLWESLSYYQRRQQKRREMTSESFWLLRESRKGEEM